VVAIKQTIYRAGANSELMEALINAAAARQGSDRDRRADGALRRGSQHQLGRRLEEAGAQVVYGVVGLKTHAKLALVLRREPTTSLRRYAHLGTGNYNPTTTKHYTDFGLLTSIEELTADVNEVFIHLTSMTARPSCPASGWRRSRCRRKS
jgi:polyphosphate kinase